MIPTVENAEPGDALRAKWLLDGCSTLAQCAERLRTAAEQMQALHDRGWTLDGPIDDDYGHLVDPQGRGFADLDGDTQEQP